MIEKAIWLDMDGSFVDLYGVENWLEDLISCNPRPYIVAKPLINLSVLARTLNKLQKVGYTINIVSWLARHSTKEYDQQVTKAKQQWLNKHLPSVKFNRIEILPYGTPKSNVGTGFLFDDEERNRDEWRGIAFSEKELLSELKKLALFAQPDEEKVLTGRLCGLWEQKIAPANEPLRWFTRPGALRHFAQNKRRKKRKVCAT